MTVPFLSLAIRLDNGLIYLSLNGHENKRCGLRQGLVWLRYKTCKIASEHL